MSFSLCRLCLTWRGRYYRRSTLKTPTLINLSGSNRAELRPPQFTESKHLETSTKSRYSCAGQSPAAEEETVYNWHTLFHLVINDFSDTSYTDDTFLYIYIYIYIYISVISFHRVNDCYCYSDTFVCVLFKVCALFSCANTFGVSCMCSFKAISLEHLLIFRPQWDSQCFVSSLLSSQMALSVSSLVISSPKVLLQSREYIVSLFLVRWHRALCFFFFFPSLLNRTLSQLKC